VSELTLVSHLAEAWRQWEGESTFPFSPDCCINGTRVATRALAEMNVRSRPVSVQFTLFNHVAYDLWKQGVGISDWPPHAWSLGVRRGEPVKEGKWGGHLLCEGSTWLLDISARQFDRSPRIVVDGPQVFCGPLPADGNLLTLMDGRQQVWMWSRSGDNAWRSAPGWHRMHDAEVRELVRRTLRRLR